MSRPQRYTGRDFTFVVCAYKECEHLEQCVRSLLAQSVKAHILISTSTPNSHIRGIAEKYGIPLRINPDGGQVKDYNFALNQADTALVMLMHQDDLIRKTFVESVLRHLNRADDPILAFTNYLEMHHDKVDRKASTIILIKRLLLLPIRIPLIKRLPQIKRLIQLFGNPITHPTVVCVRDKLPKPCFREEYKASMDWDLWERLSREEGQFVYVPEVLLFHRMNEENQTAKLIRESSARYDEELEIFCRFWPKPVARLIMKLYSLADRYY